MQLLREIKRGEKAEGQEPTLPYNATGAPMEYSFAAQVY
jgi:hypothetical protein